MQSCEYMKVSGPQKTKLLTLKKIMFFKNYENYPMERLSYILQSGYQLPLSYKKCIKKWRNTAAQIRWPNSVSSKDLGKHRTSH